MGRFFIIVAAVLAVVLADASVAFAQVVMGGQATEIPWSGGTLDAVLKEAKERNVPLFIYSGNDT